LDAVQDSIGLQNWVEGWEMSNGVPWSTDDDVRLGDLARSGLSPADIANQMNRSVSLIYRHARILKIALANGRNGITTGRLVGLGLKAKLKWTFREQRRLLEIAASSKSFEELVDRAGRSPKAVRKMTLRLGISFKFNTGRTDNQTKNPAKLAGRFEVRTR
jgi:DNA-binding CsgD family transcriptional regulator